MRVDGRIIGALVSFCVLCLGCRTCSENVVCSFLLSDAHWAVETNLDKIIADAGNPDNITRRVYDIAKESLKFLKIY